MATPQFSPCSASSFSFAAAQAAHTAGKHSASAREKLERLGTLAAVLSILLISVVQATQINVDDDPLNPGVGMVSVDNSDGLCSLREAIINANNDAQTYQVCPPGSGPDAIALKAGSTYTVPDADNSVDGQNGLPSITSQIAIAGNGATVRRATGLLCTLNGTAAASEFRIFHISVGGGLSLDNVTVSDGCADGSSLLGAGGAILNLGALMITRSTVTSSSSYVIGSGIIGGGGIYSSGTLTVSRNSTINGNYSKFGGGGIANTGTLGVSDSTISGNTAVFGGGGMINGGTATVNRSALSGNHATDGGGIDNSPSGTLTIDASTISGNSATKYGGGVNNTKSLIMRNCTVSTNSAGQFGGGINVGMSGALSISNCTLYSNSAGNFGGGIYTTPGGSVSIKSSIVGNSSSGGDCNGAITATAVNFATDATCIGFTQKTSAELALGILQINSPGTTATHALGSNIFGLPSVAIDAASDCKDVGNIAVVATDQRGVKRPQGPNCDVGAHEADGLKYGMTWVHLASNAMHGTITVGCNNSAANPADRCNPKTGDTLCGQYRPLLCIYGGKPTPAFSIVPPGVVNTSNYSKWSGGVLATTKAVQGSYFQHLHDANNRCIADFGLGWRVAEFHDGWGWSFQAYGGTTGAPNVAVTDRFWVNINDQPANCWDQL